MRNDLEDDQGLTGLINWILETTGFTIVRKNYGNGEVSVMFAEEGNIFYKLHLGINVSHSGKTYFFDALEPGAIFRSKNVDTFEPKVKQLVLAWKACAEQTQILKDLLIYFQQGWELELQGDST